MLIWITGLAGAGKTTIATELFNILKKDHSEFVLLDGDCFREIIGQGCSGYDLDSRKIIAMRMAKLCEYLTKQNINVICATISMYKEIYDFNRSMIKKYYEVFIDVSMDNLVKRDKKQLYSKAIENVVGVDLPFDKPSCPDLIIDNNICDCLSVKVQKILDIIKL